MWENDDKRSSFRRTQSTADVNQIQLGQEAIVRNRSINDDDPFAASYTPIFAAPQTSHRPRPLPELYSDDHQGFDGKSSDASKLSYFLDGKKRVDFILVYTEPHDEYLVTATPAKEAALQRQFYVDQLRKADLQLENYRHHDQSGDVLVFIKVHVPWAVLCREAERARMRMPLILEDQAPADDDRNDAWWWRFFASNSNYVDDEHADTDVDDPPSFGGRKLTWTFDRQHMHMFKIDHPDTFFSWRHRTEIVWNILQQCRNDRKHDRRHGVETLLERGLFEAAFPLHDGAYGSMHPYTHGAKSDLTTRQRLHVEWAGWSSTFKPQPLNRIRNYFGEKFGFYFAFMDFYTKMLIFPSAFGLLAFVYGLIATETTHKEAVEKICDPNPPATGSYFMCPICNPPNCAPFEMSHDCGLSTWQFRLDNEATLLVSCATLVWCALFVKFWKRREATLAVDWDTYETREEANDHRSHVAIRAAYEERAAATKRSNPVTLEPESYVPRHKRLIRMAASIAVATLLLIAAGGSLMGLIVSRIALYGAYRSLGGPFITGNVEWSRWTVHGLIFLMIVIFEWIYDNLADRLTELECPKTTEQFLSSLLWKLFIFEELVDFLPIAYAAWFRGKDVTPRDLTFHSEICEPNGCMSEVVELVAVLLLSRLVIGNIAEIAYPAIKTFARATIQKFLAWWSSKSGGGTDNDDRKQWPQWLKDFHLNELKLDGVAEEYMEMMIQFSFVAFFVPAFPLIPLVCLLNNVAEIRVDGINFLASHRRPVPMRVPGLQIWNKFMEIILKVAVLCNAALIAFTSEIVPRFYYKYGMPSSNATLLGYKAFSLSKMMVSDWPQLQKHLREFPMPEAGASHGRFARDTHGGGVGEARVESADADLHSVLGILTNHSAHAPEGTPLNDTHEHCYYLDFRQDQPPYDHRPIWWKIFCLRVAAFTFFLIIFYILLFLCDFAISDVPGAVTKRLKRREYLVQSKWSTKKRQRDDDQTVAQFRWMRKATILTPATSPSPFSNETKNGKFANGNTPV